MTILYEVPGSPTVNACPVNGGAINQGSWYQQYTLAINRMQLATALTSVGLGFVVRAGALRYQVATSADDVLYVIVKRTINGQTVRNVERLHSRYLGEEL